jgi:5'(3')-deoxyribonucleotidase
VLEIGSIYCDMDQVLVNFLGGGRKALGREINDLGLDNDRWPILINEFPTFWLDLEWMPNAQKIWERIHKKDVFILTACPPVDLNPVAGPQKKQWCERELGISPNRVITVQDRKGKLKYSGNGNLIIDDHLATIMDWCAIGGQAIHHHTVPETIMQLRQFGL